MDFLFEMIPIFILMLGALIHLYVRVRQTDKVSSVDHYAFNKFHTNLIECIVYFNT